MTKLNGIDIASYQGGIDLSNVPCDFVIVKATEGTSYLNPYFSEHANTTLTLGKKLGIYHFASGGNVDEEANFFADTVKSYIGKAILILDWEADALSRGVTWAKQWLDRVCARTGVKPLIYMSNSVVNGCDWTGVASAGYGLWNAGYYAGYQTMGYNPDAPLYGGTGAWGGAAMYQYTSSGRLSGWGGNLDLNVFYGDSNAWDSYVGKKPKKTPMQVPGNAANNMGLYYRAHCQTVGTLSPVHDGQTAGTVGYKKQMEALWVDLRNLRKSYPNAKLSAKLHIQSTGWKKYNNVEHDTMLGSVGKKKRIEAIELEMAGLPEGKNLYYRTHLANTGWTPWIQGGFSSGTVGLAKRIEAIQIKIQ